MPERMNLFTRISRYTPTDGRSPREDILTQCFAATLDSVDGLAGTLVASWLGLDEPVGGEVHVDTQVSTPSRWRIDLELRFGERNDPDWLVWVEVKKDAELSGHDQLHKYARDLNEEPCGRRKALVFLPRVSYTLSDASLPKQPSVCCSATNWQRTGNAIVNHGGGPASSDQLDLVTEFVDHLKEEGLLHDEKLTPEMQRVLLDAANATSTFDALVEEAMRRIESHLETRGGIGTGTGYWANKRGSFWPQFWRYRDHASFSPMGHGYLEFDFRKRDAGLRSGEYAFGAGLTLEPTASMPKENLRPRLDGFEFLGRESSRPRVARLLTLDELTAKGSYEAQVYCLASFACDAFDAILAEIPPQLTRDSAEA